MNKKSLKPSPYLFPVPAVMVSCGEGSAYNIITVAWAGTVNSDPPMASVSIRKERHSFDIVQRTKEFVINIPAKHLVKELDYCGVVSGRDVDKFEKLGLTPVAGEKVSAPLIEQCPVNLECKVVQSIHLGTHDMFIGEIVAVHVDENLVLDNGGMKTDFQDYFCYVRGSYVGLDSVLGTHGYSVQR